MFKNKLLKVLALLMVLNILIIPLTNFIPQHHNKYTVHASGELVDIRFFNAMVTMIGVTAVGVTGMMSQSFSIPEVDMVALKDQFQSTLDADATKKTAWLNAQADYLAGGVAKTMGAAELAKIGLGDIYNQFISYLKNKIPVNPTLPGSVINDNGVALEYFKTIDGYMIYTLKNYGNSNAYDFSHRGNWFYDSSSPFNRLTDYIVWRSKRMDGDPLSSSKTYYYYDVNDQKLLNGGNGIYTLSSNSSYFNVEFHISQTHDLQEFEEIRELLFNLFSIVGIDSPMIYGNPFVVSEFSQKIIHGDITYNNTGNIVNSTDSTISIIPTIPWFDPAIPVGTVVTPAISVPYAGTVPIDIPKTVTDDPVIVDPVDPPVEDNILGTVAAILAGLTPIAGFLEYILAGQVSLTDAIEAGLTNVVDGIGDIAETLTGGISSTLTDIKMSISTLFDPPTDTLDTDKLKNINSVLFTKFPFSIPFDFTRMIGAFNAEPVAPTLEIPFDMSSFGGENSIIKIELSQFDNIAFICRQIGFVGFVFFMLFNTRKLIWK